MSLEIAVMLEHVSIPLVADKISKNPFIKAKDVCQHDTVKQNGVPDAFLRWLEVCIPLL